MLRLVEAPDFVLFFHPQTDGLVKNEGQYKSYDEGIGTGCHNCDQLDHQLLGVAGQQAGGTDRGKNTGNDCAEGTADTVDAEGIQGVVILEPGFEQDAAVADHT